MDPFLGEIRMVGFNYAPQGWAFCNGQLVSIQQYSALFALLGTQFGGNGVSTFGLPDLRGRAPISFGQGSGLQPYTMGQSGGAETVTLTTQQMPMHNHTLTVDSAQGSIPTPSGSNLAPVENPQGDVPFNSFTPGNPVTPVQLHNTTIGTQGQSQAHENRSPYQAVNFIIALQGVFPPRS